LEVTRLLRRTVVNLLFQLVADEDGFFGVDDDDEIAHVGGRRELRLVLATQHVRDARSHAAHGLSLGVNDKPGALDLARLGMISFCLNARHCSFPYDWSTLLEYF